MFDIDHLYLASYNYNVNKNGSEYAVDTAFDGSNPKYYQNKILECLLILLVDQKSANLTFKSIDNDTILVKGLADQIPSDQTDDNLPFNITSLHEQVTRKNDYITGKKGIGPFALNLTNQILTYLTDVTFKEPFGVINNLHHLSDTNGNPILSWMSAFVNAHVDIVKDPYISKLNVNPFTYNTLNLLIRSGIGDSTMWFLTQPIIRAMAHASNNYSSNLLKSNSGNKSLTDITKQAIYTIIPENIFKQYQKKNKDQTEKLNDDKRCISEVFSKDNQDTLRRVALGNHNNITWYTESGETRISYEDLQYMVYQCWNALRPYANALSNLIQVTKVDTRKYGKTFAQFLSYNYAYECMFGISTGFHSLATTTQKEVYDNNKFDTNSLHRLNNETWIYNKTRAISDAIRVLGTQVFSANSEFNQQIIQFAEILDPQATDKGRLNTDLVEELSKQYITYLKSNWFSNIAEKNGINVKALFVGNRSVANRLNGLKRLIQNGETTIRGQVIDYSRLRDNALLNQLYTVSKPDDVIFGQNHYTLPQFITVASNIDESRIDFDLMVESFDDLLHDTDPIISRFAKELALYMFFSSGNFSGFNKLAKYIPVSFYLENTDYSNMNFGEYIQNALDQSDFSDPNLEILRQIAMNNVNNRSIVKNSSKIISYIYNNNGDSIMITTAPRFKNPDGRHNDCDNLIQPDMFVRVRRKDITVDNNLQYDLYQYVRTQEDSDGNYCMNIYMKIPQRGYHVRGFDIYEYGNRNLFDYNPINSKLSSSMDQIDNAKQILSGMNPRYWAWLASPDINNLNRIKAGINMIYSNPDSYYLDHTGTPRKVLYKEELDKGKDNKINCKGK